MCEHKRLKYNKIQEHVACLDCGFIWKNDVMEEIDREIDNDQFPLPYVSPSPWEVDIKENTEPCMFDGLPPGVYGISCPCPRCSPTM